MKLFLILFFLFWSLKAYSLSIKCDFEEIYQTGEIQQGFFLLKNKNLRYEYFNKNLYTILYLDNRLFVSENTNRLKTQIIENRDTVLPYIMKIYDDFPDIKKHYSINNYDINIDTNNDNFIKRIGINSNELKLSIYFINCKKKNLLDKYFDFNPIINYVQD